MVEFNSCRGSRGLNTDKYTYAGINVVTAEAHLPLRNAIVSNQQNNLGTRIQIDQTNGSS